MLGGGGFKEQRGRDVMRHVSTSYLRQQRALYIAL
jgi:hypothetical protein